MRARTVLFRMAPIVVLAIITLVSGVIAAPTETSGESGPEGGAGSDSMGATPEVVLYYFHGTHRCKTCLTIESYSQQAVQRKFKDALEAGTLSWTVLNTDEPENAHFVKDFGLVSSSLVLVEVDRGKVVRHKVLQDAWTLVRDKPRFVEYVQGSVAEFLE